MDSMQISCPDIPYDAAYSEYFGFPLEDAKYERELQDDQILSWTASSIPSPNSQTVSEPSSSFTAAPFDSVDIYSSGSVAALNQTQLLGHGHLSASPYSSFLNTGSSVLSPSNRDGHIPGDSLSVHHATIDFSSTSPTVFQNANANFILSPAASVDLQQNSMLSWSSSPMDVLLHSPNEYGFLLSPPADDLDQTSEAMKSDQEMDSQEAAFDVSSDRPASTSYFHHDRRHHGRSSVSKHSRQWSRNQTALLLCDAMMPAHSKSARRHSTSSITRKSYACRRGDCSNSFSRQADLERHIDHVHTEDGKKKRFECDYPDCQRKKAPFHRKDHFRDHLRDQHKEDIPKRGSNANQIVRHDNGSDRSSGKASASSGKTAKKESEDELVPDAAPHRELKDCVIQPEWWRCSRCLKRVRVEEHKWTCPTCKGRIEQTRQMFRSSPGAQTGLDTDAETDMCSDSGPRVKEEDEETAFGTPGSASD
ncbi:transcription factor c2h2 [Ophiostoma piceae UAMH 11346]|uniref:Transcription factor c2h2 n=1 Tax=Ophiostoma piceae (strain UAMH 11346) TaxID=1262450 RepID=S3C611_OPHP1|nr:transcription factor c2h2 [Ophiostoma piceae UAMH 11346]